MKIAVAGYGDVGRYFIEVLCDYKHEVVLLSRRRQQLPDASQVEQRITDYTAQDLIPKLQDCDAVISTLSGPEDVFIATHLAILEACKQSTKCKSFIPSEFTINVRDFPDQPIDIAKSRNAVHAALREQDDVKWTIVCNGWFMDYLLPSRQRYLKDLGSDWPMDDESNTFDIPGDGSQKISLTSVRDSARAIIALLENGLKSCDEHTFYSAQTLTYTELFELLQKRRPGLRARTLSFTDALDSIARSKEGYLRILGFTNANQIPDTNSLQWDQGILAGVKGRSIDTFLDEAQSDTSRNP